MPKIVIQVNTDSLADAQRSQPREIIEYRWDRIITALVLLCLLIGGISWAIVWTLKPQSSTLPVAELPAPHTEANPASMDQILPPAVNHQAEQAEATAANTPAPELVGSVANQAVQESIPEPTASAAPALANKPAPESDLPEATPAALTKVNLLSNRIRRAQLTTNVVNREPIDHLPASIPMNEQGLLRIYLFTETAGLEGRTLFHHWYRNGKSMARVQLPGLKQPTTLSSSKFIDRHMTGTWTVKVVDDRNLLLAETQFEVHP